MCCLDPVLWLTTRSTGRAWRSVSRRFFFRFVSPCLVLLFHSFRTISLRFGESRLLRGLFTSLSPPIHPSLPLPVSLQGRMTVDRTFCCQVAYLFKQTSGMQNHDMSAPIQPVHHPAFTRPTVGRKKTSCIRANAGQEERPKRTLRGSRLHLLFICFSAFATKEFIRGMKLQEKGRAICEEGPEEVLSTSYTGLLLAVYLRYSPEYKYYRQESTKNRRQFPVGSVCKHRPKLRREQCGWQLATISAAVSTVRPMPIEQFLSWRPSLPLAHFISRVCGHRWSKSMRPTVANALPPALCGMSMYGQRCTLFHHYCSFRDPPLDDGRRAQLNGNCSSFPIDCLGFPKRLAELPALATTAHRARGFFLG
jgi:hypothetical protein